MAKRSPILGYNHNVRYRGLIFHVQTEDSGLQNPHLFTHLFHEGVIVSTRKLVYDSGSDEGAIKSLMQAQHKAVMKDLKRGHFDDKIDVYLVDVPGLLPRGEVEERIDGADAAPTQPMEPISPLAEPLGVPGVATLDDPLASLVGEADEPIELAPSGGAGDSPILLDTRKLTPRPRPLGDDLDGPTLRKTAPPPLSDAPTDMAKHAAHVSTHSGLGSLGGPATGRTITLDRGSGRADPGARAAAIDLVDELAALDSSPEIEIQLSGAAEDDALGASGRRRTHDTEISGEGAPGHIVDDATRPNEGPGFHLRGGIGESIPPLPPTPDRQPTGERAAVGAASLPPARPVVRPPTRPAVPAVPARPDAPRSRNDSDAVEVYAPLPSDSAPERPGQYAQHRRMPPDVLSVRDRSPPSSQAIPAGLSKPPPGPSAQPPPVPVPRSSSGSQPTPTPPPTPGRTPTPARVPHQARTGTPGSGGVVMTRPAVIVGAPAKPATPPRVRKAREEEGRGFGQGLISEKSLDEVILAYLSEDADDK
ncbi:MAG: hypothetical protein NT062_31845 [Proteobacteria bacterium]|nr:hypothetical protein [Pseudomonadota bacterium]